MNDDSEYRKTLAELKLELIQETSVRIEQLNAGLKKEIDRDRSFVKWMLGISGAVTTVGMSLVIALGTFLGYQRLSEITASAVTEASKQIESKIDSRGVVSHLERKISALHTSATLDVYELRLARSYVAKTYPLAFNANSGARRPIGLDESDFETFVLILESPETTDSMFRRAINVFDRLEQDSLWREVRRTLVKMAVAETPYEWIRETPTRRSQAIFFLASHKQVVHADAMEKLRGLLVADVAGSVKEATLAFLAAVEDNAAENEIARLARRRDSIGVRAAESLAQVAPDNPALEQAVTRYLAAEDSAEDLRNALRIAAVLLSHRDELTRDERVKKAIIGLAGAIFDRAIRSKAVEFSPWDHRPTVGPPEFRDLRSILMHVFRGGLATSPVDAKILTGTYVGHVLTDLFRAAALKNDLAYIKDMAKFVGLSKSRSWVFLLQVSQFVSEENDKPPRIVFRDNTELVLDTETVFGLRLRSVQFEKRDALVAIWKQGNEGRSIQISKEVTGFYGSGNMYISLFVHDLTKNKDKW